MTAPSPPCRRPTRLGALAVAAVLTAAVAAALSTPLPTILAVPAPGEVRPDQLPDGTPLLVSHLANGPPAVLDARVPIAPGWTGVTGWCERRSVILERVSARRWGRDGSAHLPAGPGRAVSHSGDVAPPLARYDVDVAGDQLRVGERRAPDPAQPVTESRQFQLCPADIVDVPELPGRHVTFGELEDAADGWVRLRGVVVLDDGPPRLCPPPGAPDCRGPSLPPLADHVARPHAGALTGTVSVRLHEGTVDHIAVPADSEKVR